MRRPPARPATTRRDELSNPPPPAAGRQDGTGSRDVLILHTSDLHLGADSVLTDDATGNLPVLRQVLSTAREHQADLVILAGDTFDHNRQGARLVEEVSAALADFSLPIVILPGNHDPLTPDSVYRRSEFGNAGNVHVLGLTADTGDFPELDLEVWGRPHVDYLDMMPLPGPPARRTRWQLAVAHGHYVEDDPGSAVLLGSWLIRQQDLTTSGADYVALGHWNRAVPVGDQQVPAYYSGSPGYAGTLNAVRLQSDGRVVVDQIPFG